MCFMTQSAHRTVRRQHAAVRDDIGELITRRPLPGTTLEQLDPFLFLNHHGPQHYPPNNRGLPFGPHPHRGFETVTFILEGSLAHADSGDHQSVIETGGVQWMTAGSGLVHAEVSPEAFKRDGGALEILQLWINLPARLKMVEPAYTGLQRDDIPKVELDEGRARLALIAGALGGETGPIQSLTDVFMSTLALSAGARIALPVPRERTVFLYVVDGEVSVGGTAVNPHHLIELEADGDEVLIEAELDARLLFGHASALNEPMVSYGPFVMNTREEIQQAVEDYQAGRFGGLEI
ncbi:pirin family protein [Kushneria phosphatilytica]|uniref:Pirin family protein n=1 Tax=Kushneria phosphatilytica TaxID=657387 RepID=A0A5C1A1S0_9GAMM|nr:pirin family protein [Kushneria phosphatilytica]QEL12860.1 pirin family protein [Kushneria phosphatilytica]